MTGSYVDDEYDINDGLDEEFSDSVSKPDGPRGIRAVEADGTTTGWGYLGLLCLIAVGLTLFAKGCDGGETNEAGEAVAMAVSETELGNPVDLRIQVDEDTVTLIGSVPDEGARSQLVSVTGREYGAENVVDQLVIDETTTLTDGLVSVTGNALVGDVRPEGLQQIIVDDFGLSARANSINRGEQELAPVDVEVNVTPDGAVKMFGAVPDQDSIDDLIAAAVDVWGISSLDSSGMTVDDTLTWEEGVVRVTGSTGANDDRASQLEAKVTETFGALVSTDTSAITVEEPTATAEEVETEITAKLAAQPILFSPESSEIDSESDEVLTEIAALLESLPDASVELVGHTDDIGPADENLALSEQRAAAVRQRLIDEGVEEARISARGVGEAEPLVENSNAQNRAQNRRIEFVLVDG